jgi:hypothetical protein
MIPNYTEDDLLLLADMSDSEFRKGNPPPSFRDTMRNLLGQCTPHETLTFFCSKIIAIKRPGEPPFLHRPIEDVPLFVNDPDRTRRLLVRWRLSIGK